MTVALLNVDWQTLADAVALGSIYALMAENKFPKPVPLRGNSHVFQTSLCDLDESIMRCG